MRHSNKGRKQSPEHIAKRVASRRVNGTYMHSDESRAKMSAVRKGKSYHTKEWITELSKRMKENHPMKGKKHSEESRLKMSKTRKGVPRPHLRGENSHLWRGGKTEKMVAVRRSVEYRSWRKSVFERDDYICQACSKRGGNLDADHVMPVSIYPEMIYDTLNGRTLCHSCHKKTPTYSREAKKFEPAMTYLIFNYS